MKQEDIRQALIDGTICVVARDGLNRATTKALSCEAGVNEVNIYRMFDGKEDLYSKTFAYLDNELISVILKHLPIMDIMDIPMEERCRVLFLFVWKYLVGNSDKCMCYIRYYYSPYFQKYSIEEHKAAHQIVIEKLAPAFREGANFRIILNHILDFMLMSAVKVHQTQMPNTDKTAEEVYSFIYSAIKPQLAWSLVKAS